MKLKSAILAAILCLASASAFGTTVGFTTLGSQRTGQDSTGVQLSTSTLVWVGTFSSESFSYASLSSQSVSSAVAAIKTAGGWEQFGVDTSTDVTNAGVTNTIAINGSGRLSGSEVDNTTGATKADFFNGKSLYVWVFNASTIGAATEMGIFRATDATTAWNFATNAGGVGDITTYSTNPSVAPTFAAIGNVGTTTSTVFKTATFGSGPVPEPSRLMLFGLGVVGLVFRRRRA